MNRTETLLERALVLIMDEWGKTREEALAWLNDDATDWTPTPPRPCPSHIDGRPAFIQVTRISNCAPPGIGLTTMRETLITPAMIDDMAKKEKLLGESLNKSAVPECRESAGLVPEDKLDRPV